MKIFMKSILLAILISWMPAASCLAAVSELYTGEAVVENQKFAERNRALPIALKQSLQKLSGLQYFDDYPLLELALGNASSMVMSFHYRNDEKVTADGSIQEELRLVVRFSETEVTDLIKSLQLPLWQPERSPASIWVVVDDGFSRRILPVEFAYAWDAMSAVAETRGLPITWPKTDEEGNYAIDAQLLWGGYTEDVVKPGQPDVLVAAARREGPEWNVRFNLAYGDRNWTWRYRDIELQTALVEGLQTAIDEIAMVNSIAASDQGIWVQEITVAGLYSANDYSRCLAYLEGLSVVDRVSVLGAGPGKIHFKLDLNALPEYLDHALLEGSTLESADFDGNYTLLP
jgi:hypothetical protein